MNTISEQNTKDSKNPEEEKISILADLIIDSFFAEKKSQLRHCKEIGIVSETLPRIG